MGYSPARNSHKNIRQSNHMWNVTRVKVCNIFHGAAICVAPNFTSLPNKPRTSSTISNIPSGLLTILSDRACVENQRAFPERLTCEPLGNSTRTGILMFQPNNGKSYDFTR